MLTRLLAHLPQWGHAQEINSLNEHTGIFPKNLLLNKNV